MLSVSGPVFVSIRLLSLAFFSVTRGGAWCLRCKIRELSRDTLLCPVVYPSSKGRSAALSLVLSLPNDALAVTALLKG